MRPLDWERVLTEHRVPFVTSGPNVSRGEVNIRCCFCGSADPSYHMGINLETGWWSCWRNRSQHSGKSPVRLLMRLLRVSYGEAREIAGLGDDYVDPDGFGAAASRFMGRGGRTDAEEGKRAPLKLDERFLPVSRKPRVARWWNYLYQRGFSGESAAGEDVDVLCTLYNLRAGVHGPWRDRLIIPYYQDGELVTWTGRAITPAQDRYWDLSVRESTIAAKQTLFNHDAMVGGGRALVLVEGPIDTLKLDFYGRPWGVRAVGLSTNSASQEQAFLLRAASDLFGRLLVMMDNASVLGLGDSMRMRQSLAFIPGLSIIPVPFGAKDAGELTSKQATTWARAL